jgi:hypothetical protein
MSVTSAQAVTLLENVLFESPTIAEANAANWVAQSASSDSLSSVAGLAAAMAATPEAGIAEQVVRYYMGALGRVPAGNEIQFYINVVEAGLTADQLAQGPSAVAGSQWAQIAAYFAASPEFTNDFGLTTAGQVDSSNEVQVIFAFYANILGRVPNTDEISYYQKLLDSGTSLATLVQYFTTSPEYQTSVDTSIATALGGYGTDVANGTTPPSIPLTPPGLTLGSSPLTVTGTSKMTAVSVVGTPAAVAQTAQTAVTGVIPVSPVTAATGVQGVTGVTGVAAVAGRSAVTAVTDGAVTINDIASSATGAGVITTVYLANSGAGSVINDNGLTSLTLIGTTGTLALTNINTAAITAHTSSLALVLNGLSNAANTVTDTNNEIATLNITTTTADSVLAGFADTHLTTLTLAGSNALTLLSINASLTALTISGAASFSDGATTHTGGLAALGSHLTISETSTGTFTAALDDTTQTFSGGSGADTITVSSLVDATKKISAGSATTNEIIFEGGNYALSSASSGKFVNFQTVGVAANVTGVIDLSIIDPTAKTLEVIGANSTGVTFTKAASGAALLIDPSSGATVTVGYADSTGAKDSTTVTMSSAVSSLTLQDAASVGIATVNIVNTLAAAETNVSPAHTITTLTDNGLSTLNVTGTAGLGITTLNETSNPAASLTLNNASTDGYGVAIGTLNDTALATMAFAGTGVSTVGSLNTSAASLSVSNAGTVLDSIGTITDNSLTSLTLAANVALGQVGTASTANGLQDSSTAGVTIAGGSDNAHVTVNLLNGAASGKTDAITLGNGNNVVVDASTAGTVNIVLGTGANLVELGSASLDTTAKYNVTFTARTATPPNAVFVGAAGTTYNSAPNLVVTGATAGDIIAFGNDTSSSAATLTATSLTGASSVANAITMLETVAAHGGAHTVAYGAYGGNTYIVETVSGTVGSYDTSVVELAGYTQALFASLGYVNLGTAASTLSVGNGLVGTTIPAGTIYNTPGSTGVILNPNGNVVTMVGPSTGITDTFVSALNSGALTINYQATSGTDTILMKGSVGAGNSDITSFVVNDTSTGSAGLTIGAFTGNGAPAVPGTSAAIPLSSVTYNNSAAAAAIMTQQTLTSATLNTINFTGGVAGVADSYFFTGVLSVSQSQPVTVPSTPPTLTINDSNIGSGTATLGLTLTGGPSILNLNMTGAGSLVTGILPDDNLAFLNLSGTSGTIGVGAVTDAMAGTFTVKDTSTSTSGNSIALSGLSQASAITINDSSSSALTDSSAYTDSNLTLLTLNNTGAGALTIANGGLSMITSASSTIYVTGSGTGTISTGPISDAGGVLTINDDYAATGTHSLANLNIDATHFLATSLTVNDSSSVPLTVANSSGTFTDASLTQLSLINSGSSVLTLGTMTTSALTSLQLNESGTGSIALGPITDSAIGISVSNVGTKAIPLFQIVDNAAATFALTIPTASIGALSIALSGAGGTALNISDEATSSVSLKVDTAMAITIDNSAAGTTNNFSLNDATPANSAITLTGAGNQAFTLTDTRPGTITIGTLSADASGSYSITLPTAVLETINLPTVIAGHANTTAATAYKISNFILDSSASPSVAGDTLSFAGAFTNSNVLIAGDVNGTSGNTWTITNGIMSSPNATVLNFIAAVQAAPKAGGVAGVSGIAGFVDGSGNTWIAYNDLATSGGNVSVIELVGQAAAGLETGTAHSGYIHIT